MNNKQLATARRVMSQYPGLTVEKTGQTLTPKLGAQRGQSVTVTDTMPEADLRSALTDACEALIA